MGFSFQRGETLEGTEYQKKRKWYELASGSAALQRLPTVANEAPAASMWPEADAQNAIRIPNQRSSRSRKISRPNGDIRAAACGSAQLRRTIQCATTFKVPIQVWLRVQSPGCLAGNLAAGNDDLLPDKVLIEITH